MSISKVIKRDGRIVKYNKDKIVSAVLRSMTACSTSVDEKFAVKLATSVDSSLEKLNVTEISVEEIQDLVEDALIKSGDTSLVKEYILYRVKRAEVREYKDFLGIDDDLKLGVNSLALLQKRYLKRINGKIETPTELFRRVANAVAQAEKQHGENVSKWSKRFYNVMSNQIFLPNTPCLANAGRSDLNHLFACVAGDTTVRCAAGDYSIKDLASGVLGDSFDVFTIRDNKVSIAKAFNVQKTGVKDLYRVSFDDGSYLDVTKDHKIMLRNGEYCEAGKLKLGVSVMPFNYDINHGYQIVFEGISDNPIASHKLVMDYYGEPRKLSEVIHHKDYNKRNNSSNNLEIRDKQEHIAWHAKNAHEFNCMYNPEVAAKISTHMVGNTRALGCKRSDEYKLERSINNPMYKQENKDKIKLIAINKRIDWVCPVCGTTLKLTKYQAAKRKYCSVACVDFSGTNNPNYKTGEYVNHKVVSVVFLRTDDVYDMSVEGTHNFATNNVFIHNCYAFEVGDSIEEIFGTVKHSALVQKTGGGVGLHLSYLRPSGDLVSSTEGIASGPVDFMRAFDVTSDVIKQGGIRRGGNMGLLLVSHPDIAEFVQCKNDENKLNNFNISVAITDEFMDAVAKDADFDLRNPKNGEVVQTVNAKQLFSFICHSAWMNGEPGIVFWDKIEVDNPTPKQGHLIKNLALAKGTKVFTNGGMFNVEDLVGQCTTLTDMRSVHSKGVSETLLTVIPQGEEPILNVVLNNGQSIRVTGNHKLLIDKSGCRGSFGYDSYEFVRSDALKNGDKVCIQSDAPIGVFNIDNEKQDFGRVVGWLLGDGSVSKREPRQYSFICNKDELFAMNFLESYCSRFGNVHFHNQKGNVKIMQVNNNKIREQFTNIDHKRDIPEEFLHDVSICKGMLQGLFSSDGSANKKNRVINLTSINKKKLYTVQLILSYFGIKSSLYKHSCKHGIVYGDKTSNFNQAWCLNITGKDALAFRDVVGFYMSPEKDEVCKAWSSYKVGGSEISEVVSVIPDGVDSVYEVVANTTHSLIANGIIVSNCGEQDLLPFEACCLGSINLDKFVDDGKIVYPSLRKVVQLAVRFLDDVIDVSSYPLEEIREKVKGNRKIGLGVMGLANMLLRLGLAYDSQEGVDVAEEVMTFIDNEARKASIKLGEERGSFLNIKDSVIEGVKRNSTVTTVAPTGSIGTIADTSPGIEPIFMVVYQKTNILEGDTFFEMNPVFEEIGKKEGWYNPSLVNKVIRNEGSVQGVSEVPEKWQRAFRTALEVSPEWHVKMQAAFQRHVDNAISKTINLPYETSVDEVESIIQVAYDSGLKGVTVFRHGSRSKQVMEPLCPECEDDVCPIS